MSVASFQTDQIHGHTVNDEDILHAIHANSFIENKDVISFVTCPSQHCPRHDTTKQAAAEFMGS